MSGRPRTNDQPCTGDWACDPVTGHCVCWWDARNEPKCCQCGVRRFSHPSAEVAS